MSDQAVEALQELYRMVRVQEKYINRLNPEGTIGRGSGAVSMLQLLHGEIRRLYHLHAAPVGHL